MTTKAKSEKITWDNVMKVNKIYKVFDSCKTKKQLQNAITWMLNLNLDEFCKNAFVNYLSVPALKKAWDNE